MPTIEIQEIYIPDISIPVINDPQITIQPSFPQVPTFGCTSTHRDTKNTGNFNLIFDDPSGTSTSCPYPTFIPLNYQPDQLIIVEESLPSIDSPPLPKSQSTEVPPIKKKKRIIFCHHALANQISELGIFVTKKD